MLSRDADMAVVGGKGESRGRVCRTTEPREVYFFSNIFILLSDRLGMGGRMLSSEGR